MKMIPVTRGAFAIVDDDDYENVSRWTWGLSTSGHVQRMGGSRKTKRFTIHIARQILNPPNGMQVDHINRDKMDNRKCNLRIVEQRVNILNRGLQKNSTTGYRGVWWHKHTGKYTASITSKGITHSLGYYDDPAEAAKAYSEAATKYHGKYNPYAT